MIKIIWLMLYYCIFRKIEPLTSQDKCLSNNLRYMAVKRLLKHCGKDVDVRYNCYFGTGDRLSVGDRSSLGMNARLGGSITIGNDCMMGPDVVMMAVSHEYSRTDIPIKQQGPKEEQPIFIGDDCWIGTRVVIMPGVHLGKHCIVGSGAVVTKSFPDYSVIGGVPAKLIKYRVQSEIQNL